MTLNKVKKSKPVIIQSLSPKFRVKTQDKKFNTKTLVKQKFILFAFSINEFCFIFFKEKI